MPKPHLDVFGIQNTGEKSYWTKIGVAFRNKDESINVQLTYFPINGQLNIREPKEREDASTDT